MVETQLLDKAVTHVRKQLSCLREEAVISGLTEEKQKLHDLLFRTAKFGESNSIIIIGPRGCGKSLLVKCVLTELRSQKQLRENLLEVHLNGLVQTNDNIAIQEIALQLGLENVVGDRVTGTFAENLKFLLDALKSGDDKSKLILFILDEFDLFTYHKNQTLLYNLFDIAQSAQAPVCVVGMTTRLDVMELLEKRVKSRFSHRLLHLVRGLSFEEYQQLVTLYLSLPAKKFSDKKFVKQWNQHVQGLESEQVVIDLLKKQYNLDRDIRKLQALLLLPVSRVSCDNPFISAVHFVESDQSQSRDAKGAMLKGLSILQIMLIIAMKHLDDRLGGEPFNFEMIYQEYQKFVQSRANMQVMQKAVVLKAFEELCSLELVTRLTDTGMKEHRLVHSLVDSSQLMQALQSIPSCPTDVQRWAQSTGV